MATADNQNANVAASDDSLPAVEAFIKRWEGSGAAERANYQLFLSGTRRESKINDGRYLAV
jgi:hypothetical protein